MTTAASTSTTFPAGDIEVTNAITKKSTPIKSFYQDKNQPILLVFLRRWGCPLCRGYAKDLNINIVPLLRANNVGVEAVGVEWLGIEEFQALNVFPNEQLYVDDGKKAYKKLGLEHLGILKGITNVFTDSASKYSSFVKDKLGVSGNLKGDGFQLGATYVLSKNGDIWFEHRQKDYGDHPPLQDIVNALKKNIPEFNEHPPGVAPMKSEAPTSCL
jgi:hypothetical protein